MNNFYIEAANHTYINNVQVYPQVKDKKALVRVKIKSDKGGKATIWINGKAWNTPEDKSGDVRSGKGEAGENLYELLLDMEMPPSWSEISCPALYRLNITIRKDKELDNQVVNFGMREFSTIGTQFAINGFKTFLRGKHGLRCISSYRLCSHGCRGMAESISDSQKLWHQPLSLSFLYLLRAILSRLQI